MKCGTIVRRRLFLWDTYNAVKDNKRAKVRSLKGHSLLGKEYPSHSLEAIRALQAINGFISVIFQFNHQCAPIP